MRKKVFKVVGIVLGVVLALVGIIVGIMAIRGKFKTPVVYPTQLVFENDTVEVVNYYNREGKPAIFSFTLTGVASGKNPVNRKTCYIHFVDRVDDQNFYGEELIILCDANGNALQKIAGTNKYKINCNEPVYFTLNNFGTNLQHFAKSNFGTAVLQADDERGMARSNLLKINVDQAIEQIRLQDASINYEQEELDGKTYGVQSTTVSLGSVFDFNLAINPEYSFRPIASKPAKVVEYYYYNGSRFETGNITNDYELIDEAFLQKPENNFVKFVEDEDGKQVLRFEPLSTEKRRFIVAAFDSYTALNNFVATKWNYQKVDEMVYTVIDLEVISDNVETVNFRSDLEDETDKIYLNLYTNNNYITLNGQADVEGDNINNNDLGLLIDGSTTSRRFAESSFGINMERFWSTTNIAFKTKSVEGNNKVLTFATNNNSNKVTLENFAPELDGTYAYTIAGNVLNVENANLNFTIAFKQQGINIGNKTLVESLTMGEDVFECSNGAAFVDKTQPNNLTMAMLRTGSYLDLFEFGDNAFSKSAIEYSATSLGVGENKSFNIVVKQMPQDAENLYLMLLIVNSNGELLFAKAKVEIQEQAADIGFESLNHVLNITYNADGTPNYGEIDFDSIVSVDGGSYSAGVFITKKSNDGNYSINVLTNLTFNFNSTDYVLVGYMQDGKFVNAVKASNLASSAVTEIYVLLLKNAFEQTAQDTINNLLELGEHDLTTHAFDNYISSYPFKIENRYMVLEDALKWNFNACTEYEDVENDEDPYLKSANGNYYVLEQTNLENGFGHKFELSSNIANMLKNLGILTPNNFKILTSTGEVVQGLITITEVRVEEDQNGYKLVVLFNVGEYISDDYVVISLTLGEQVVYSPHIYVQSQAVDGIYMVVDGEEKLLSLREDDRNMPELNINIGFNNESYTYTVGGETFSFDFFNTTYSTLTKNGGFKPSPAYNKVGNYNFAFQSNDENVLSFENGFNIKQITSGIIVTVVCNNNEAIGHFKIVITADANFAFEVLQNDKQCVEDNINLTDLVEYKFGETILTDSEYFSISNITSNDSAYRVLPTDALTLVDINNDNAEVVKFVNSNNKWQIVRQLAYEYRNITFSFDVYVQTALPKTIKINFTNDITVNLNTLYYSSFYANTEIVLAEKIAKDATTTNCPMFVIRDSKDSLFKITYDGQNEENVVWNNTNLNNATQKLQIGNHSYYVYLYSTDGEQSLIGTFHVNILPNIVMSQTNAQSEFAKNLVAGQQYNINQIATLQQYKTNIVFGSKIGTEGSNYYLYNSSNLEDISNFANLSFSNLLTLNQGEFTTQWIENLDEVINQNINLTYQNSADASNNVSMQINVIIKNKYAQHLTMPEEPIVLSTRREYASLFNIDVEGEQWLLTNVECEILNNNESTTLECEIKDNKFTITSNILKNYDNAKFVFTYSYNGKTLKYCNTGNTNIADKNIAIKLTPYAPELWKAEDVAAKKAQQPLSEKTFNLVTDVFNTTTEEFRQNFASITISNVSNPQLIASAWQGLKFTTNAKQTEITFGQINKEAEPLTITYSIEYANGGTFQYEHTLTISNYQEIVLQYPFENFANSGLGLNLNFANLDADTSAEDLAALGRQLVNYEPVSVGQTISFDWQDSMSISRVSVLDRSLQEKPTIQDAITQIKLVAYRGFFNTGIATISGTSVKFNNSANFTDTYLVFKITTTSNNYAFYVVRLYNNAINPNYEQVSTFNSMSINNVENTYYADGKVLGNQLNLEDFGVYNATTSAKIYLYLLNYTLKTELNTDVEFTKNALLTGQVTPQPYFMELKIGLVYVAGGAELYLGNIIANIKPNVAISSSSATANNPQNGEYYIEWDSKLKELNNPFTVSGNNNGNPTATLFVQQEGFKTNPANTAILLTNAQDVQILNLANRTIERLKYLTIDLQFTVKYVYSSGLILYLNVTMHGIETPTSPATAYQVGEYKNGGFVKTLTLESIFNGYASNITISNLIINEARQDEFTMDLANNQTLSKGSVTFKTTSQNKLELTFSLSHKYYFVSFIIVYTDLVDTGSRVYSSNISVDVNSAINVQYLDSANGKNPSAPLTASIINEDETQRFASASASQIQFVKSGNSYTLGDLTIITEANAQLLLEMPNAEDFKYAANHNFSTGKYITGTESVNFAHTAQDKVVEFKISILQTSGEKYTDKYAEISLPLYVKVPQTYIGFVSSYLVKDSSHENVSSAARIDDIRAYLFQDINNLSATDVATKELVANNKRIGLRYFKKQEDGSNKEEVIYDYNIAMGFNDVNNANYVEISTDGTSNLSSDKQTLTFNEVSTGRNNLTSTIVLSNSAGVEGTSYNFQIIAGKAGENVKDGIVKNTSDKFITEESSFNFVVNDATPEQNFETEEFNIASLIDKNNSAFYITNASASINGTTATEGGFSRSQDANTGEITYSLRFKATGSSSADYELILARTPQKNILIKLSRLNHTATFNTLSFSLTLYGEGGVIGTFELNFFNCTINNPNNMEAYAGSLLDLSTVLKGNKIVDFDSAEGINITIDYDGNTTGLAKDNNLFKYDDKEQSLDLKAIPNDRDLLIFFLVKVNQKTIGSVSILIRVKCDFEFRVNNGDTDYNGFAVDGINPASADSFNYYISDITNGYTITIYDPSFNSSNFEKRTKNNDGSGVNYYNKINVALYSKRGNAQMNVANFSISKCNEAGETTEFLNTSNSDGTWTYNFGHDFNGTLMLRLEASTLGNGSYVCYLNINVLGKISLTYTGTRKENSILPGINGAGFTSNSKVNLVSKTNSGYGDTGVIIYAITDNNNDVYNEFECTSAQYLILDYDSSASIVEAFTKNNSEKVEAKVAVDAGVVTTTLPFVSASDLNQRAYYTVAYELQYKYTINGIDTTGTLYVSYKVYNNRSLDINGNNNNINVDSEEQGVLKNSNLNLFFYQAEYTAENKKYVVYYNLSEIRMIMPEESIEYVCSTTIGENFNNGNALEFVPADESKKYDNITNLKIDSNNSSSVIITFTRQIDKGEEDPEIVETSVQATRQIYNNNANTLFSIRTSSINSIAEFKKYIDAHKNVELFYTESKQKPTSLRNTQFDVKHDNKGLFYITLSGTIFVNEFTGKLRILSNENAEEGKYTVEDDYSLNLTTNQKLTPKGHFKLSDIFTGTVIAEENNYDVIGIGTPNKDWVSTSNGNTASKAESGDLVVYSISYNNRTYDIYLGTWTGSNSSIYTISEQFYYISGASSITTINYSGGSNYFIVKYTPFKDSSISASDMSYIYKNDDAGALTRKPNSSASLTGETQKTFSELINYKNSHINETYIQTTPTLNGQNVEVRFELPLNPTVVMNSVESSKTVTSSDLSFLSEVISVTCSSNFVTNVVFENGNVNITFNTASINSYFNREDAPLWLTITFNTTRQLEGGGTVTQAFDVLIKNSN